jgi:hypothetical protein
MTRLLAFGGSPRPMSVQFYLINIPTVAGTSANDATVRQGFSVSSSSTA